MSFVFFVGMAGSGKSTLTGRFGDWLGERGYSVARVNLDPGALILPYKPDWDIRKYINLRDIMVREGLGPNGGLIRAHELMIKYVDKISLAIKSLAFKASYILVDTPGQLELFAFREIGPELISRIGTESSLSVFIIDAANIKKAADAVMSLLLALAVNLHLDLETVFILNKADIPEGDRAVKYLRMLLEDPVKLSDIVKREGGGVLGEMAFKLVGDIREFMPPTRIVAVSAKEKRNFYDLFSIIHDVFCGCGDLT